MGKNTRFFRKSVKEIKSEKSASNFSQVIRSSSIHTKLFNLLKIRGK